MLNGNNNNRNRSHLMPLGSAISEHTVNPQANSEGAILARDMTASWSDSYTYLNESQTILSVAATVACLLWRH